MYFDFKLTILLIILFLFSLNKRGFFLQAQLKSFIATYGHKKPDVTAPSHQLRKQLTGHLAEKILLLLSSPFKAKGIIMNPAFALRVKTTHVFAKQTRFLSKLQFNCKAN